MLMPPEEEGGKEVELQPRGDLHFLLRGLNNIHPHQDLCLALKWSGRTSISNYSVITKCTNICYYWRICHILATFWFICLSCYSSLPTNTTNAIWTVCTTVFNILSNIVSILVPVSLHAVPYTHSRVWSNYWRITPVLYSFYLWKRKYLQWI